jgi:hypothetical protein
MGILLLLALLIGCSNPREREAQVIFDTATKYADQFEFEKAKELFIRIETDYADTSLVERASEEVILIEELLNQKNFAKQETINKKFLEIALALEDFFYRYNHFPPSTADLKRLENTFIPEFSDDQGVPILYKPYTQTSNENPQRPTRYVLAYYGNDLLPGGKGEDQDFFFQSGGTVDRLALPGF